MMRIFNRTIVAVVLVLAWLSTNAQSNQTTQLPTYYLFNEYTYTVSAVTNAKGKFTFTFQPVANSETQKKEYPLELFTFDNFHALFKKAIVDLQMSKSPGDPEVEPEAKKLFMFYKAAEISSGGTEGPPAGKLCLKNDIVRIERFNGIPKKYINKRFQSDWSDYKDKRDIVLSTGSITATNLDSVYGLFHKKRRKMRKKEIRAETIGELEKISNSELEKKSKEHELIHNLCDAMRDTLRLLKAQKSKEEKFRKKMTEELNVLVQDTVKLMERLQFELEEFQSVPESDAFIDTLNHLLRPTIANQRQKQFLDHLHLTMGIYEDDSYYDDYLIQIKDLNFKIDGLEQDTFGLRQRLDTLLSGDRREQTIRLIEQAKWQIRAHFDEIKKLENEYEELTETNRYLIDNYGYLHSVARVIFKMHNDLVATRKKITTTKKRVQKINGKTDTLQLQILATNKQLARSLESHEIKRQKLYTEAAKAVHHDFKIDDVQIEFKDGHIENIVVIGKILYETMAGEEEPDFLSRQIKFENVYPLGFSRKLDYHTIKEHRLWCFRGLGDQTYFMKLDDLIEIYIQEHRVGRRDFSPADQEFRLSDHSNEKCHVLKKLNTFQLFQAKVFSDFVGLDQSEPNGLIQTEISKRIPLLTDRLAFTAPQLRRIFGGTTIRDMWNFGMFSYVEPGLTISKIEENNKNLVLGRKDAFVNDTYLPIKFASTLSIKQHEHFSAGLETNIVLLDMPSSKATLYGNIGWQYGRTGVVDSIFDVNAQREIMQRTSNDFTVNTFNVYPKVMLTVNADERYGFHLSWQNNYYWLRSNAFKQVANTEVYKSTGTDLSRFSRRFHTVELQAFFKPSRPGVISESDAHRGQLFFRYRYNWQAGFWRTGYHQAQIGYAFNLLGRKESK